MASCDMEAAPLGDLAAADPVRLINADWSPELPDPTSPNQCFPAAADVQQHTSGITTIVPEPEQNDPEANEDTACEEEDFDGLLYASRDEAIAMAFASVDANKDGKIDASELRALVPLISPAHNKKKVRPFLSESFCAPDTVSDSLDHVPLAHDPWQNPWQKFFIRPNLNV